MSLQAVLNGALDFATTTLLNTAQLAINPNPIVATALRPNPALGAAYDVYDDAVATLVVEYVTKPPTPLTSALSEVPGIIGDAASAITQQSGVVYATDKFIVTGTTESPRSKFAPTFSFGAPTVYTAGKDVEMMQITGHTLVNKVDGDLRNDLYESWQNYMRAGAQLIGEDRRESPWIVRFEYRDMIRRGYLVGLNQAVNAAIPAQAELALSMFVIEAIQKK